MLVRFKLNRGPRACRTMCGEPYGSIFSRKLFHPYLAIQKQPHQGRSHGCRKTDAELVFF